MLTDADNEIIGVMTRICSKETGFIAVQLRGFIFYPTYQRDGQITVNVFREDEIANVEG